MSQLLHLCLLDVKRTKPKHEGICTSMFQIAARRMAMSGKSLHEARVAMGELNDLIEEWPKAKDPVYPVEGDSYGFYQDKSNGILWENHDRLELLDWLIERTKDHDTSAEDADSST